MQTLEDLFQFISEHEQTIVFGNLGRYPQIVFRALMSRPHLQVAVVSRHKTFPTQEPRIRLVDPKHPIQCDWLIVMEPQRDERIRKPFLASRMVVFTSHFAFETDSKDWWNYVCYFEGKDLRARTHQLMSLEDVPVQTRNVGLLQMDHANVVTLSGGKPSVTPQPDSFFIVDLTQYRDDLLKMYLSFLDAFDCMLDNASMVSRWVTCFPERNGAEAFRKWTQKTLNVLFCKKMEHGNYTSVQEIVTLLPFYKFATVNFEFGMEPIELGGMKMLFLKSVTDVAKASVLYNLVPITKNAFYVQE